MTDKITFNSKEMLDLSERYQSSMKRILTLVEDSMLAPLEKEAAQMAEQGQAADPEKQQAMLKTLVPTMKLMKEGLMILERVAKTKILLKKNFPEIKEVPDDRFARERIVDYIAYLKECGRYETWLDMCVAKGNPEYTEEERKFEEGRMAEIKEKQREAGMPEDFNIYDHKQNRYLKYNYSVIEDPQEEKADPAAQESTTQAGEAQTEEENPAQSNYRLRRQDNYQYYREDMDNDDDY